MKNLTIGALITCTAAGSFVFTEKYFGACVVFILIGMVLCFIGTIQIISEFKEK